MAKQQYRDKRDSVNQYDIFIFSVETPLRTTNKATAVALKVKNSLTREGFKWKAATGYYNDLKEASIVVFLRKDNLEYLQRMKFLKTIAFGALKQESAFFASNGLTSNERVRTGYLITAEGGTVDKGLFRAVPVAPKHGNYTIIDGAIWATER